MPGNPFLQHSHLLLLTDHFAVRVLAPVVMLAAAVTLVALCVSGRWSLGILPARAGTPGDAGAGPGRPRPA